ncbi:MAG: polyketide synthase [Alectoria sarmentosa]|nr:MAG: polyketide synthase [Alectoria sarmentosa]
MYSTNQSYELSIEPDRAQNFAREVAALRNIDRIDHVILNAGILQYPNRATELSFDNFSDHLRTNAVGPIITAQRLLHSGIPIGCIAFMSSDSGSATAFRDFEDGFAAYAASKAALNQMLRVYEIASGWEVEGIINVEESVAGMLRVVEQKTVVDTGTFWTWEGNEQLVLKHSTWLGKSEEEAATLFEEISDTIDGQMVVRIGKQLVPILRQQVAPLELMLEGQLLYKYYKGALRIDRSYAQVNQLIRLFRHKNPQANILEIGGGTGGCTECILDGLGGGNTGTAARFAHYDAGEEKERKNSPSLTDFEDPKYVMSVLMSTAKSQTAPVFSESVVIYDDGGVQPPASWLDNLKEHPQGVTIPAPAIKSLDCVNARGKVGIILDDTEQSILAQPTSAQFKSLWTTLLGARGVLWISSQVTGDCKNPKAALRTGFLRTLRAEDNTKRYITLDIANENLWTADAINSIVKTYTIAFNYSRDTSWSDSEFAVSAESINIPRLYEVPAETQSMTMQASDFEATLQPFHQSGRELRMGIETPGMIDSLCWHDDPEAGLPLPDGWVEIEPRAFGLNFRDVLVAMGQLDNNVMGLECSGTITRLGAGVPEALTVGA